MKPQQTEPTREERIETLLLVIAGCEISLRQFPDDMRFCSNIKKTKALKLKQLREVIYGLETMAE
jgi:hypothetical protein